MSKRNHIVERASDVNGGQYIQTNPSYNSGYEDGKKAGKEYCASEIEALREQVEKLTKERDELHRAFNQPVPWSEWEKMQEQLAALTEQNEKLLELREEHGSLRIANKTMRDALQYWSELEVDGFNGAFRSCCASRPNAPHTSSCICMQALE